MLFIVGCSSKVINGSSSGYDTINSERVSLNNAIFILNDDERGLGMGRQAYTVHNIIGRNLTPDGKAASWALSVNSQDPFYFFYTPYQYYTVKWMETEKDRSIDLEKIIFPDGLFSKHTQLIANLSSHSEFTIDELQLRNGVYRLSGSQEGKAWEYTFDAVTGNQLP